jgi:PAS domain S-box-containing protein
MKKDIQWWQIIAACILIAGIILTVWSAQQQDRTMRNDLLLKASIANSGISTGQVASLSGTAADITSPEYQALKAQLEKIHASDPTFRFAYLMGQREDGTVILYADSEPPSSEDYSPPGEVYSEASATAVSVFLTGDMVTEGPLSDRWGTWVTGFTPVIDPATGRVIAIFGMDVNAQNWNTTIFKASLPTLIASLLIVLLVLVTAFFQRRSDEERLRLKISEEKFSKVFHANPALMAVSTLKEGRFLDVNSSFLATFGYSRNEVIGKTTSDLHLFFDTTQGNSIIRQIQETGQVRNLEVRFFRKNQDLLDGTLTSITVDVAGIPRLLTIILDLTDSKRAEAALQRQATILAILNEVITSANIARNLNEATEKVVDEILRLLDYDAGGIYLVDPGSTTATIIHSKNLPPAFFEEVKTISIVKPPYNVLFTEGTPIISSHYDEIDPGRSKLSGFLSLATIPIVSRGKTIGSLNVASRKRDEISGQERQILLTIGQELGSTIERLEAFRESENAARNLMTLFDSVNEMVFVLDMQGRIITVNEAVKKQLLYAEEELAGTDVLALHVPERQDEALQNVQGMIAGIIDSCPVPILKKDGTRIEAETKVTRGTWNNQDVLIGVTRDITERKHAEEALKKSEELLNLAITGSGTGLWDWNVRTGDGYKRTLGRNRRVHH